MNVCIHRGAHEIGGSCVELEFEGARLVLDVGQPLEVSLDEEVVLPPVCGLTGGDPSLLGVLISHGHPDHYGLAGALHPDVPLYLGEATARILTEAAFFAPSGLALSPRGYLRDRETFRLGPFEITPYLIDHSAFDAHALLIEAGGRRLFYSGDLRAHGRKATTFERLIAKPPIPINCLLLEGTHVRRGAEPLGRQMTERDVEREALEVMRGCDGIVLALYSAQNIDRLVSLYRAARRADRTFVYDLYGAAIAAATANDKIPQADWEDVRVYLPGTQRRRVIETGEFERVQSVRAARIYAEELATRASKLVFSFRASMRGELERAGCLTGARAIWSLWHGYLEELSGRRLRQWFEQNGIPLAIIHASGHASVRDLQRLAEALQPTRIVPIHTAAPERFPDLFSNVALHGDGIWWSV